MSNHMSQSLTVIITTSPTPSAPSVELLASILGSFREHCPVLLTCRVIVVIDTFDRVAPANRLKKGCVTAQGAANFPAYKRNVENLVLQTFGEAQGLDFSLMEEVEEGKAEFGSPGTPANPNFTTFRLRRTADGRVTLIEPTERLGFGLAVRSALRVVETPYVWVQQHDWRLDNSIPIDSIVEVMRASEAARCGCSDDSDNDSDNDNESGSDNPVPVRYVCLPSVRLLGYADSPHVTAFPALREATARHRRDFPTAAAGGESVPLTPLFFWHDKTHIASTRHYLDRVFPTRLAIPRGAFIEDHIGQRARNQTKEGLWGRWACWLYYPDDGRQICLRHLHGRTWRGTEGEREKIEAFRLGNGSPVL